MALVNAGKMDKRVTFQKLTNTVDDMGQDKKEWTDYKTRWADFYPIRGGEYQEADKKKREEVVYKCKIRYLEGIDASMRIVFRGRIFLIDKVINVNEDNYQLDIECTEYVEKEVMSDDGD